VSQFWTEREFQTDGAAVLNKRLPKHGRGKFVWMGHAAVARTTIAMTACYFVSWCVDWDIRAQMSDVSCRSGRPVCRWCAAPLVTSATSAAASWREIAAAPAVRLSRRCSALAAASEWCRTQRREAHRFSSRFQRESDYMQASVLGPQSVDGVLGGSLAHGSCTISPRLTHGCQVRYLGPKCLLDRSVLVPKCSDTSNPPEQCRSASVPICPGSEVFGYSATRPI